MDRDIICFTKASDDNEELRYAIRSWEKNLPHRNIILVGHRPSFLKDIDVIEVEQQPNIKLIDKYHNTTRLMIAACQNEKVSDTFYLANDDFFIMKPVEEIPMYHWGTIADVIKTKRETGTALDDYYMNAMEEMPQHWQSYALHLPMPIGKHWWLYVYDQFNTHPSFHANKRTIYGNNVSTDSPQHDDVKIYDPNQTGLDSYTYLSTAPNMMTTPVGRYIKQAFPERSRYEK